MSAPTAGWYPDPEADAERYWDGSAWTEHVRALPDPPAFVAGRGSVWSTEAPAGDTTAEAAPRVEPDRSMGSGAPPSSSSGGRGALELLRQPSVLSTASLVAAIVGVALFWWNGVGGVIGVVAVVLAMLALRSNDELTAPQRALSTSAVTVGSLAVGLAIALLLFGNLVSNAFDDAVTDLDSDVDSQINSDPSDGDCDFDRFLEDPDC